MWTNPRTKLLLWFIAITTFIPIWSKSHVGWEGVGVSGGRGEIQTLRLNHKVCIKNNPGPQMANVNKITWLIFCSLPQASSRRGSAKSQINVDLETTEAFCLRGLWFFLSFFRPSSHLAPRLVIFPRIKLSWWNKAEGVRRRGRGPLARPLAAITHEPVWLMRRGRAGGLSFSGLHCASHSVSLFVSLSLPLLVSFSLFS